MLRMHRVRNRESVAVAQDDACRLQRDFRWPCRWVIRDVCSNIDAPAAIVCEYLRVRGNKRVDHFLKVMRQRCVRVIHGFLFQRATLNKALRADAMRWASSSLIGSTVTMAPVMPSHA